MGPVALGNRNTCAEVKLFFFLFMPAAQIVCREPEVLKAVGSLKKREREKQKRGKCEEQTLQCFKTTTNAIRIKTLQRIFITHI